MSNWTHSNVCQLPPLTDVVEWIVPADESMSCPPTGYVVPFVAFHEHNFSVLVGPFIREVLLAYGLHL
jgi:hypothetical protein